MSRNEAEFVTITDTLADILHCAESLSKKQIPNVETRLNRYFILGGKDDIVDDDSQCYLWLTAMGARYSDSNIIASHGYIFSLPEEEYDFYIASAVLLHKYLEPQIKKHSGVLSSKRSSLIKTDEFGYRNEDKWIKYVDRYANEKMHSCFLDIYSNLLTEEIFGYLTVNPNDFRRKVQFHDGMDDLL